MICSIFFYAHVYDDYNKSFMLNLDLKYNYSDIVVECVNIVVN